MYRVSTSDGNSFLCKEYADAVAMADSLWQDSDHEATVVVELDGEVAYKAGN